MLCALPFALNGALVENYSDLHLSPESYWNGSDSAGYFESGSAVYYNDYDTTYGSWSGFAYSNRTNGALSGVAAQFSSLPLGGMSADGTTAPGGTYAIGYYSEYHESMFSTPSVLMELTLTPGQILDGLYVTNSLYSYTSMREGDAFAKKFGGSSGNDKDWFLLTITGHDTDMNVTGAVDVYLADYRFDDNSLNYILDDWLFVDLNSLGIDTQFLSFGMASSDVGDWGINTPTYFVLGGLNVVPEPMTTTLAMASIAACALFYHRTRKS